IQAARGDLPARMRLQLTDQPGAESCRAVSRWHQREQIGAGTADADVAVVLADLVDAVGRRVRRQRDTDRVKTESAHAPRSGRGPATVSVAYSRMIGGPWRVLSKRRRPRARVTPLATDSITSHATAPTGTWPIWAGATSSRIDPAAPSRLGERILASRKIRLPFIWARAVPLAMISPTSHTSDQASRIHPMMTTGTPW